MAIATISRTDQDIQSAVLDELTWEPRVQPHEIGVTVAEGVVTLTGRVDSYAKKWAAERAAHRVARVRAVANDLAVRLPRRRRARRPGPRRRGRAHAGVGRVRTGREAPGHRVGRLGHAARSRWSGSTSAGPPNGRSAGSPVSAGSATASPSAPSVPTDARNLADRIVDALARSRGDRGRADQRPGARRHRGARRSGALDARAGRGGAGRLVRAGHPGGAEPRRGRTGAALTTRRARVPAARPGAR